MTEDVPAGGSEEAPDGADDEDADDPGSPAHRSRSGHGHGGGAGPGDGGDHHAHDLETVGVAVVTVSSTRDIEADPAGDAVEEAMEAAGHEVVIRELVRDDYDGVQSTVARLADREDVDCVVTAGGTGVSPDDVTIEAIAPLLDRTLPGFGELFRQLSREEIGTRVIATRATAGMVSGVPVFCLPGSEQAARLGAAEIVAGEAGHLAGLARR